MSRVTEFPDDESGSVPAKGQTEEERTQLKLPKLSALERISEFYQAIKLEMKKTSWPTRTEVWSTTLVVLIAILFFGFYLWGVDQVVTLGFRYLEKIVG